MGTRKLKGIGEKNFLAGIPDIDLLPQPHQILWWQVDITPLVNEQLGNFFFGINRPMVLSLLEALPLSEETENYKFRQLRGTKTKDDSRLNKRHLMLEGRLKKADARILKHQDAVDRRVECAGRRQMRIEDRFSRNWRLFLKREDKAAQRATRKEDRAERMKEREYAMEALKSLKSELKIYRERISSKQSGKSGTSPLQIVKSQIKMETEVLELLQSEAQRTARVVEANSDMIDEKKKEIIIAEAKHAQELLEKQEKKMKIIQERYIKVKSEHDQDEETEKVKAELAAFYEELETANQVAEKYFDAKLLDDDLPDDMDIIKESKPLTSKLMDRVEPFNMSEDMMMIWDFFVKFSHSLQLCDKPDQEDGLYILSKKGVHNDDDEDDDDEEMENESTTNNNNEGEDDDTEDELPATNNNTPVKSKSVDSKRISSANAAIASASNGRKKMSNLVYPESNNRTPIVFLPEIRNALFKRNMHFLGPVHFNIVDVLFRGSTSIDEASMSEAAKERRSVLCRYAQLTPANWTDFVRWYLLYISKQLELCGREDVNVKTVLHHQEISVSMHGQLDEFDDEEDPNVRRIARKVAKQKLLEIREEALKPIVERLDTLTMAPFSETKNVEKLLSYPGLAKVNVQDAEYAIDNTPASSVAYASPLLDELTPTKFSILPMWIQKLLQLRFVPSSKKSDVINIIRDTIPLIPSTKKEIVQRLNQALVETEKCKAIATNCAVNALLMIDIAELDKVTELGGTRGSKKRKAEDIGSNPQNGSSSTQNKRGRPTLASQFATVVELEENVPPMDLETVMIMRAIVRFLSTQEQATVFCWPVDLEVFTDYLNYVEEPMDLQTIDIGLVNGKYKTPKQVMIHVELVWANCKSYNQRGSEICRLAGKLSSLGKRLFKAWVEGDKKALYKYPYEYETKLPEAPWGGGGETIKLYQDEKNSKSDDVSSDNNNNNNKRKLSDLQEEELEKYKADGFVFEKSINEKIDTKVEIEEEEEEDDESATNHKKLSAKVLGYCKAKNQYLVQFEKSAKFKIVDKLDPHNDNNHQQQITTTTTNGVMKPIDEIELLENPEYLIPKKTLEDSLLGTIVVKFFQAIPACLEGFVQAYDPEMKQFKILFKENEYELFVGLEELVQMQKDSVLLRVGSETDGVQEEARDLARLEGKTPHSQAIYRRNVELNVDDPLAPIPLVNGKEVALLRRLAYKLSTSSYEDLDFETRVQILRVLCEQSVDSAFLRDVIETKSFIHLKTGQRWRLHTPRIVRDSEVKQLQSENYLDSETVMNRLCGDGVAEQNILEKHLQKFQKDNEGTFNKNLSRAVDRVQRDIEKQKRKKHLIDEKIRWRAELEWKCQTVQTAPTLLGYDRFNNKYMYFGGDYSKIYVHLSDSAVKTGMIVPQEKGWHVIAGPRKINLFLDRLNPRGVREANLLTAIQERGALFLRGSKWVQVYEREENIANGDGDATVVKMEEENYGKTLVGERLAKYENKEPFPDSFYHLSRAGEFVGNEVVERHVQACNETSEKFVKNGTYEEKSIVDLKIILLNIEYAILLQNLDDDQWMHSLRRGWIRLVTSAQNWRDLAQACAFLEANMGSDVPFENWFLNLYGDAGYCLRCKTFAQVATRITALDHAINYFELVRIKAAKLKPKKKGKRKR